MIGGGLLSTYVSLSQFDVVPWIKYIGRNSIVFFAWHQVIVFPIVLVFLTKIGLVYNNSWTNLNVAGYDFLFFGICLLILTLCSGIINVTVTAREK